MAKLEENIQNNSILNNNSEINAINAATIKNRENEIIAAAYEFYPNSDNEFVSLFRAAFICGARWSDAHPKYINKQ